MSNRKLERMAFDLPPKIRKIYVSRRAKRRQEAREEELERELQKEFAPVMRMAVATDLHIHSQYDRNAERLEGVLDTAYSYADSHPTYKSLDAVLLIGDNVDSGAEAEYDVLMPILEKKLRPGTKLIPVMGNHEYANTGHEGFVRRFGKPLLADETVKGFHVLGLSTDPVDSWHTPKQALWMLKKLREAKKDTPDKPIFTMQHGHIFKTVYVSRSWYTQLSFMLHAVYSLFPQVINFSGHSHGPVNHPLNVWQKKYTLFGAGTLNCMEMERDISDESVPEGSDNVAQYLIVEVDAANRVRVLPFNVLTGDFFKRTDGSGRRLEFLVKSPKDKRNFVYTSKRALTDEPPRFAPAAKVEAKSDGEFLEVSFPQANAKVCSYGYRIEVSRLGEPNAVIAKKEIYSGYYFEPVPQSCSTKFKNLPDGELIIKVTPLNVWRDEGLPIYGRINSVINGK